MARLQDVRSDPLDSLKGWVARRSLPHATALTRRLAGRRAVAILEYPFEPTPRWGWNGSAKGPIFDFLADGTDRYAETISHFTDYIDDFERIQRQERLGHPSWDNDFWAGIDAVCQYTALVRRRPALYLEIGSGNSTLFARQAVQDHDLPTRIVSIDPAPRADVDAICDEVHRVPLDRADLMVFDELVAGDILVVDGSHTAFMGSDAVITLIEILPRLAPGVLVGFDDIFLPWDYPPQWAPRWYGEQYLLATLLLGGAQGWRVDFPGWFLLKETKLTDDLHAMWKVIGHPTGNVSMSFWMERVANIRSDLPPTVTAA